MQRFYMGRKRVKKEEPYLVSVDARVGGVDFHY
jgi:hypothetical protein